MLGKVLREILSSKRNAPHPKSDRRRVLNVGGGSKSIAIPSCYDGWEHLLLDVDARGNPDIVCDARNLDSLAAHQFDAVYCSHNLEHYYRHDGVKVLQGFRHVLKNDGFADIRVPDLESVMRHVIEGKMDLGDVLYQSAAGPVTAIDVIYGLGKEIEQSGRDYYAHKTGFTPKLLYETLQRARFAAIHVFTAPEAFEMRALAFNSTPNAQQQKMFGLASNG